MADPRLQKLERDAQLDPTLMPTLYMARIRSGMCPVCRTKTIAQGFDEGLETSFNCCCMDCWVLGVENRSVVEDPSWPKVTPAVGPAQSRPVMLCKNCPRFGKGPLAHGKTEPLGLPNWTEETDPSEDGDQSSGERGEQSRGKVRGPHGEDETGLGMQDSQASEIHLEEGGEGGEESSQDV